MEIYEIILTASALSRDAFAVAVCKGLSSGRVGVGHMLTAGAWFGGFQAFMPLIGFLLASFFKDYVSTFDHWIAFILLGLIGANMIKEAFSKEEVCTDASLGFKTMLVMAVATSIDALAVGVTFAFLRVDIVLAVTFIGVITFAISAAGVKVGQTFGACCKSRAELLGGGVLILMGLKILLEHLGVLG